MRLPGLHRPEHISKCTITPRQAATRRIKWLRLWPWPCLWLAFLSEVMRYHINKSLHNMSKEVHSQQHQQHQQHE